MRPVFVMLLGTNPADINYCYVEDWKRYYYIDEWVYNAGRWIAHCNIDVLATYRTAIGSSEQYVLRASKDFDGKIVDSFYPTAQISFVKTHLANTWQFSDGGFYVVGIIGDSVDSTGDANGITYYAFTRAQFAAFRAAVFNSVAWTNVPLTEISNELAKMLFNPLEYVASCMWYPLSLSATPRADVSTIKFGWWDIPCACSRLTSTGVILRPSIPLTKHPQAASRGVYLHLAPFTQISLYYPPFGKFDLPPERFADAASVYCKIIVDFTTGIGTLMVDNNTDYQANILTTEAKIGVEIPLQQTALNFDTGEMAFSAAAGAFNAGGTYAASTKMPSLTGGLEAAFAGAVSGILANSTEIQTKGTMGTRAQYQENAVLIEKFNSLVDENLLHVGRPLCRIAQLETLPGYILCQNAHIELARTAEECREVERLLNSGVIFV